jgi:hypothetical protein
VNKNASMLLARTYMEGVKKADAAHIRSVKKRCAGVR